MIPPPDSHPQAAARNARFGAAAALCLAACLAGVGGNTSAMAPRPLFADSPPPAAKRIEVAQTPDTPAAAPADPAPPPATAPADKKDTGRLTGRVIYTPDPQRPWSFGRYYVQRKTGHLAEAVVCLENAPAIPAAKPQQWTIDQKDYRFVPETSAVRVGDELIFTNSDLQLHNVNSTNPLQQFDIAVRPGGKTSVVCKRAGGHRRPLILGCKLHSVMKAWVYVFDHPYYQVTGPNGDFQLSGIPPGEYRLRMVHPAGGLEWSGLVRVTAGAAVTQEIRVSPDNKVPGG